MVHDYPKEKAFVYDNKIDIKDPENKNVLRDLSYNLDNYWDDSLKVRKIRQFGVFNTIVQPTTYYPERIERTIQYMQNYLATKGYNQPTLNLQTRVDTVKNEWRVYLKMEVALNKKTIIDTVTYQLGDKALQILAEKNTVSSYIKKGTAFSNEAINNELDRLVDLFRSNGYFYFTKERIFAEVDTMNTALMKLNLDPLAQINQIQEAINKSKENPSWKINFQLRNTTPAITKTYPIQQQIFYSDISLADNPDSVIVKGLVSTDSIGDVIQEYKNSKFKTRLFSAQSIIHKGDLFNEHYFFNTLNNLSALGAWQQIDSRTTVTNDSVTLHYFLVPALRRSFSFDLEGSRNTAEIGAGNLLGISTNFTLRDRNVQKKSIQSITSFRTGVELDLNKANLTQTQLLNIGQTYSFPGLMIPFKPIVKSINSNEKTNFSLNGSYIDRLNYYKLKSFTTSWGYEWKKTKNGMEDIISYKPINVEFYQLGKFGKLDSLLILNPF